MTDIKENRCRGKNEEKERLFTFLANSTEVHLYWLKTTDT